MDLSLLKSQIRVCLSQQQSLAFELQEWQFDLSRGELHEGFVFRCSKDQASVDQFIAKAVQSALVHMDLEPEAFLSEAEQLEIRSFSGRLGDTTA